MKQTIFLPLLLALWLSCNLFSYGATNINNTERQKSSIIQLCPKRNTLSTLESQPKWRTAYDVSLAQYTRKADNDKNRATLYNTFGVVFALVGLGILFFVNILLGLVLLVAAFTFLVSGANTNSLVKYKQRLSTNAMMRDVIYFKNGSEIRGTIIEQVMNDYVKIQTADKSILVFKHDEILRIAKEAKPKS
jgi:Flp pilus assembly protein TadB